DGSSEYGERTLAGDARRNRRAREARGKAQRKYVNAKQRGAEPAREAGNQGAGSAHGQPTVQEGDGQEKNANRVRRTWKREQVPMEAEEAVLQRIVAGVGKDGQCSERRQTSARSGE